MENNKLKKKLIIKTVMTVETGMHIGGSSDNVEIGGIDNPVIKIGTQNGKPFVPGSSLKGKIRSLLEQIRGSAKIGGNSEINSLFGFSDENKISKLIVRDSYLTDDSINLLEQSADFLDMPYTENKYETPLTGLQELPRVVEYDKQSASPPV